MGYGRPGFKQYLSKCSVTKGKVSDVGVGAYESEYLQFAFQHILS